MTGYNPVMEKITAREAFEKGLTRFFTEKECKYGHISERMVSNGSCVECLNEKRNLSRSYQKTFEWRLKNPGARAEESRRYREKHPEKVKAIQDKYREANADLIRERDRDSKRRIRATNPEADKERLRRFAEREEQKLTEIAGRQRPDTCDICDTNAVGRIVFDHCHDGGHFRGWICDRCNRTLGAVKDSLDLLRALANYLENDRDNQRKEASKSTEIGVRASGRKEIPRRYESKGRKCQSEGHPGREGWNAKPSAS